MYIACWEMYAFKRKRRAERKITREYLENKEEKEIASGYLSVPSSQ